MILICPNCAARSRVNTAQAALPLAQVHCGSCGRLYYVSAAHAEPDTAEDLQARAQEALARARRGYQPGGVRSLWQRARPVLGVIVPLVLLALCLWDVRRLGLDEPDMDVALQVLQPEAQPLRLQGIKLTPYAESGGTEGLLVVGEVLNTGAGAHQWSPQVKVRAVWPTEAVQAVFVAGPEQTLASAPTLMPKAADEAVAPQTLPAATKVPFVGLVPLPRGDYKGPLKVTVSL
jgi:predicted Zn finger-like uncharacterized protein